LLLRWIAERALWVPSSSPLLVCRVRLSNACIRFQELRTRFYVKTDNRKLRRIVSTMFSCHGLVFVSNTGLAFHTCSQLNLLVRFLWQYMLVYRCKDRDEITPLLLLQSTDLTLRGKGYACFRVVVSALWPRAPFTGISSPIFIRPGPAFELMDECSVGSCRVKRWLLLSVAVNAVAVVGQS
jgi:hypothetical protein